MTIVAQKTVTARKPRKCWGCAREFPKGSKFSRITTADGGSIYATYWCETCNQWWAEFGYGDDEGVEFGALRDDEDWVKLQKETEAKP